MTAEEIIQRIVRGHLRLLVVCMLLPLTVAIALQLSQQPPWSASVRLQTADSPPSSSTEADALSSRVLAVATEPDIVASALKAAHLNGDPSKIARTAVTASRLGESAIVELKVTDAQRSHAERLARALSRQVTGFLNSSNQALLSGQLGDLDRQLRRQTRQRDALLTRLTRLTGLKARNDVSTQLQSAEANLDHLATERTSLLLADTERDVAVPVGNGTPDVIRESSRLVPEAALALILGLVVGLAIACGLEILRPRVPGIRALARHLDVPVLGRTSQRVAGLANAMTLAGRRYGVETVVLVGVDDRDDQLVRHLLDQLPNAVQEAPSMIDAMATGEVDRLAPDALSRRIRFTDLIGVAPSEERSAGLVVVSDGSPRQGDVEALDDIVQAMRWPVIGLVERAHGGRRP